MGAGLSEGDTARCHLRRALQKFADRHANSGFNGDFTFVLGAGSVLRPRAAYSRDAFTADGTGTLGAIILTTITTARTGAYWHPDNYEANLRNSYGRRGQRAGDNALHRVSNPVWVISQFVST